MAKQIINIGSSEQAGDGESLRSAFDKINDNFDELYLKDTSDFDGEFSSLAGTPTTLAGYGITDAATTAQGALAATAVQPQTSLSGYGITDAYTKAEVDSEISTATSSIVIQSGSTQSIDIVAADSTVLVDSVNGTLNATTLTGALPAIDGSALTGVASAFSDLTGTPTTLAGYGITDAATLNNMAPTGAVDFTGATSVDFTGATITGTSFLTSVPAQSFASLTGKPTTISGYGITDALALGTTATTALAGDTALFDSTTTNVAIGSNATAGTEAVSIGKNAGDSGDYSQAIGNNAGNTGQGVAAVALGSQSGETSQGDKSVAVGQYAGQTSQGTESVAIGKSAASGATATATYVSGGVASTTMVVDDTTGIIEGMRITDSTGFTYTLLEQQQRVVSVDNATTLTISAVANAGTPSGTITFSAAQDYYAVAIGSSAGLTSQGPGAVAIGYFAGRVNQEAGIAIGSRAGEVQQDGGAVAVGVDAGRNNQGTHGVAIGKFAGGDDQGMEAIAIGYFAGDTGQGVDSIAIGKEAGKTNQAARSIILNATDSPLNTTQTDSLIIKPIRNASGTHSMEYNPTTGEVTYDTLGGGGSGLQSRGSVTGTTGSLADAAEADLDITGFKSYALLTITTDRAARVRLYVNAATRTADASRAEGVDPTSDAGLIAEVITTGADTVIISPGAYGFNLESSPTTTIPCRVTNKSGGTSTVQVDLNILQLEA